MSSLLACSSLGSSLQYSVSVRSYQAALHFIKGVLLAHVMTESHSELELKMLRTINMLNQLFGLLTVFI